MAADYVPAAVEVAQLRPGQKGRRPDAPRGDEEMAAPAKLFEHIRDRRVEGCAAIVEGKQYRRRSGHLAAAGNRRNHARRHGRANRFQLPGEILTL